MFRIFGVRRAAGAHRKPQRANRKKPMMAYSSRQIVEAVCFAAVLVWAALSANAAEDFSGMSAGTKATARHWIAAKFEPRQAADSAAAGHGQGGVIVAVGWPGQWTSSLTRDESRAVV